MSKRRQAPHAKRFSRGAGLIIALLAMLGPAAAVESSERNLQLEVFLNGESTNLIGSFTLKDDGSLAIQRKELKGLGIKPPVDGDDEAMVSLADIKDIKVSYDEPRQRVDVTLPLERRMPFTRDGRGSVERLQPATPGIGAVINYSLFASNSSTKNHPTEFSGTNASAQLDGILFLPAGFFQQTGIIGTTLTSNSNALRLDTSFTAQDLDNAVTMKTGDFVSNGPTWARPIRLGGAQVFRNYAVRPDLVTMPLPSLTGTAAVPSTIDVLVNNVTTFSTQVPAGSYSISNVPGLSGYGQARVVLKDVTGKQITQSLPFYTSPTLLKEGLFDFSIDGGLPRFNFGASSFTYGKEAVGLGGFRYGLLENLTVQTYGEGSSDLRNGGVGLVSNLGGFGLLSAGLAGSLYRNQRGALYSGSFETSLFGLSLAVSTQRAWRDYQDLAAITATMPRFELFSSQSRGDGNPVTDYNNDILTGSINVSTKVPRAIDRLTIGIPLPLERSSLSASIVNAIQGDGRSSRIVTSSFSQTFGQGISLGVTGSIDLRQRNSFSLYAGLTIPLGADVQASVGAVSTKDSVQGNVELARPLTGEVGAYGWRVHAAEGGSQPQRGATLAYRSPVGRVEVSGEQNGNQLTGNATLDGSIVALGGDIMLGGRIDDAFAIVNVGAPNVDVLQENRVIGRTDASGRILVPGLVANQRNHIGISLDNLPVGADISRTNEVVIPLSRSGVRLDFGVRADQKSGVIVVTDAAGIALKTGLRGKVESSDEAVVVGYDGRVYVRDLKPVTAIVLELDDKTCRVEAELPKDLEGQITLGPVTCK